jgi:hypothetical protein
LSSSGLLKFTDSAFVACPKTFPAQNPQFLVTQNR